MNPLTWSLPPFTWIATGIRALRKAWLLLRELRTHEQEILSGRDLIVRELRHNAYVSERWHGGQTAIQDVQADIRLDAWSKYATQWSAFRRRNLSLWQEVADQYDEIRSTFSRGAPPPSADKIKNLADRL